MIKFISLINYWGSYYNKKIYEECGVSQSWFHDYIIREHFNSDDAISQIISTDSISIIKSYLRRKFLND